MCPIRAQYVRRSSWESISGAHTSQHRPFLQRVMVWSCFSHAGPGPLVPVDGTLRQGGYLTILQQHLRPQLEEWYGVEPCIFQQDNAPCHKSKVITDFMRTQPYQVMEWPPYSIDLSPIENLWAILKAKVHSEAASSKEELLARMWVIWNEDPAIKQACRSLIEGMPRRVLACIEANGGPIKY